MTKKTYQGSCHCGAVAFEAKIDFDKGTTRCNCSICTKSRFWFAIIQDEDFKLEKGEGQLSNYSWIPPGKTESHLRYRFCKTCGIRTFAERETGVSSTLWLSPRWTVSSKTPTNSSGR